MDDDFDDEKAPPPPRSPIFWCCVFCVVIAVTAALSGPIFAFTLVSCISTRPCAINELLVSVEGFCQENFGSQQAGALITQPPLMHGEICTVECRREGFVPTVSVLTCDDGNITGGDELACKVPPPAPSQIDLEISLQSDAITSGEARLACPAAQYLKCKATPGGTSILVQLDGLSKRQCDALFEECRALNKEFAFQEHVQSPEMLAYLEDPENKTLYDAMLVNPGTCTLGCFTELFSQEQLEAQQAAQLAGEAQKAAAAAFPGMAAVSGADPNYCGDRPGPACVRVIGACLDAQDGDYYKHPLCTSGQAQWAKTSETHRIRYDGDENNGQAGKWIMETGAAVLSDGYGIEIARQPTYNPSPMFGDAIWNFKCRYSSDDGFRNWIEYRTKIMTLTECECSDSYDCNDHGEAIGSKDNGPNCRCKCNRGRAGDNCEIPLCQVPAIINGKVPACAEGAWIYPGATCTPLCEFSYKPSYDLFTCSADGTFLLPFGFSCDEIFVPAPVEDEFGNTPDAYTTPTTTPVPECARYSCMFRGDATGERREDGSCICICDEGYSGRFCEEQNGNCTAPLFRTILNSAPSTCEEGTRISGICTARCEDTYYPVPATLECQGTTLVPEKFRCFGGPSVQVRWCEMMKYGSIAFSGVTFLGLLIACYCFQRNPEKEYNNFFHADQLVEVGKDVHGSFNVIRMGGNEEYNSKLPGRICALDEGDHKWAVQDVSPTQADLQSMYRKPLPLDSGESPLREAAGKLTAAETNAELLGLQQWGDNSLPGQLSVYSEPRSVTAAPRLLKGCQVIVRSVTSRPELEGARGWLLDYDHETGLCQVDLEGTEIISDLPERCLDEAPEEELTLEQITQVDTGWLVQMKEVEGKAEQIRQENYKKFASEAKREEMERDANINRRLEETEVQRYRLEETMRQALLNGDAETLRSTIKETEELLKDPLISIAPPGRLASISRVLQTSKSRLEQYDQRQESRQRVLEYEERVRTGKAADWKMTTPQFWRFIRECNTEKVAGGLKAKLPVYLRSSDGQRFTVLHEACREACLDEPGSERALNRIEVVRLLCEARANKNAIDARERTPLDLAIAMGGEGAKRHPTVKALKELGLRTAKGAAAEAQGLVLEDSDEEEKAPEEAAEDGAEDEEEDEEEAASEEGSHLAPVNPLFAPVEPLVPVKAPSDSAEAVSPPDEAAPAVTEGVSPQ